VVFGKPNSTCARYPTLGSRPIGNQPILNYPILGHPANQTPSSQSGRVAGLFALVLNPGPDEKIPTGAASSYLYTTLLLPTTWPVQAHQFSFWWGFPHRWLPRQNNQHHAFLVWRSRQRPWYQQTRIVNYSKLYNYKQDQYCSVPRKHSKSGCLCLSPVPREAANSGHPCKHCKC
jgi:hypothetical protein